MSDEEDDESLVGLYEDGHWIWDEKVGGLSFISDLPPEEIEAVTAVPTVPTGAIDFKDNIDLIEQLRFRKRYQRKVLLNEPDVITVQDVKDLAIFTAPPNFLSPMLINFLHLSSTERFIRALILYCQYYLQVTDQLLLRRVELLSKIRTPYSDETESVFHENICDLRALVTKEYGIMLLGGGQFKKFHHMGSLKKVRSLSCKDARLFETLIRICIQIVWIALERRSFNTIELEVNRIFKSEIYNSAEHTLRTGYVSQMSREEREVLLGGCLRHDTKLTSGSPLLNEVFCSRHIDYRLMGIGVIEENWSPRLLYMLQAIAAPEEELVEAGVVCGILGLPRTQFNTMLQVIQTGSDTDVSMRSTTSTTTRSTKSVKSVKSMASKSHHKSSKIGSKQRSFCYEDVNLPKKEREAPIPDIFPDKPVKMRPCSETQRMRWLKRLSRQHNPQHFKKKTVIK